MRLFFASGSEEDDDDDVDDDNESEWTALAFFSVFASSAPSPPGGFSFTVSSLAGSFESESATVPLGSATARSSFSFSSNFWVCCFAFRSKRALFCLNSAAYRPIPTKE